MSVITDLVLLSEFPETKTKRGRASEKCLKKAGRFSDYRLGMLASEEFGNTPLTPILTFAL